MKTIELLKRCANKGDFVCISKSRPTDSTLCSVRGHYTVGKLDREGMWVSGFVVNDVSINRAVKKYAALLRRKSQ